MKQQALPERKIFTIRNGIIS